MTNYPVEELGADYDDETMIENVSNLAEHIVGHRIVEVEEGAAVPDNRWGSGTGLALTLDTGKRVYLADTDDCCAYTKLINVIKNLDLIDHIITGIGTTNGYTTWHIYADLGDVLELWVDWSAGNPFYYGYGFDICVRE